jgi:hypothetical protein
LITGPAAMNGVRACAVDVGWTTTVLPLDCGAAVLAGW